MAMRTRLSALALAVASAGCAPPSECQRANWEDWGPDEVTDLGYTPREAAEHYTLTETVTVTDADGVVHDVRVEVVGSPDLASYADYVNAGEMAGDVTCSPGVLSLGIDVHLSTGDGFFDDRLHGVVRADGPLAESMIVAEGRTSFGSSAGGSWTPRGALTPLKYFEVVLEGGASGARLVYFEAGGLTDCSVKGGCSRRVPAMTYEAP